MIAIVGPLTGPAQGDFDQEAPRFFEFGGGVGQAGAFEGFETTEDTEGRSDNPLLSSSVNSVPSVVKF